MLACGGCAFRHKKQPVPPPPVHRVVGTIVTVNESLHFVLIDSGGVPVAVGTALKSFTNGAESAVLSVSPEQKPPFIIGDIIKGTPLSGDQVMQ